MTTQDFASMLATAKKGAGLITAGGVTLQCIAAQHGVSKNGGDPQIVGSYKLIGGQFNGRTMKAWHTLKGDTPASVMGFFEDMAAFGIPESEIVAMGQPNDQSMAALAAKMVNKVVGADVYHQDDNRNPGKKSAWLRGFRVHTGPVPQVTSNGAAPAPAPGPAPAPYAAQPAPYAPPQQAPAQYPPQQPYASQQPVYGQPQAPAPGYPAQQSQVNAPVYPQAQGPAPATHSGMPPQHSAPYQQASPPGYPQAAAQPMVPGFSQPPAAPAGDPAQQPVPPQPVPGEQQYGGEPPF